MLERIFLAVPALAVIVGGSVSREHSSTQVQAPAVFAASAMTFAVAGQQYVAVAAGPNILCFGF